MEGRSECSHRCGLSPWQECIEDADWNQGTGDNFYKQKQLLPENFAEAAKASGNDKGLVLRYQEVGL